MTENPPAASEKVRNPRNAYITHLLDPADFAGPNSLGAATNVQWSKAAVDKARRAGKKWFVVQTQRGAIAIAESGAIHPGDETIHPEQSGDL